MLTPGKVPGQEPRISVGIILPEDQYTSINLSLPAESDYQMESAGRIFRPASKAECFFKLEKNKINVRFGAEQFTTESEIKIYPIIEPKTLHASAGLRLKNVISGRSFHWKKYIDVTLPGMVVIKKYEHCLIVINDLPIEQYFMCVATSEMGAACPPALIESQTITARSWMLANIEQKHRHLGMDVCNDDCCQRYQGSNYLTRHAVDGALNTYGRVLIYGGQICDARYSKSCGGMMESFDTIWDGDPLPYMQVKPDSDKAPSEFKMPLSDEQNFRDWVDSVPDTFCSSKTIPENELKKYLGGVDEEGQYFRWEIEITSDGLIKNLRNFLSVEAKSILELQALNRGGSGRLNRVRIRFIDARDQEKDLLLTSEFQIRQVLHRQFLYSSAFYIETKPGNGTPQGQFILKGAGWGHGAGLCQIGALGMALKGYSAEQIVAHYYPGSELKKIY